MFDPLKAGNDPLSDRPQFAVNPANFADTVIHVYADRIADDINFIIKKAVVPGLPKRENLKTRELRVLVCLGLHSVPLSPVHIADLLRYDPATVTRAVGLLVKAGKIERIENPSDTRSIVLRMTEEGRKLADAYSARIQSVFSAYERELHYGLTDEEKLAYLKIIRKVSRRTEALRKVCALQLKKDGLPAIVKVDPPARPNQKNRGAA